MEKGGGKARADALVKFDYNSAVPHAEGVDVGPK